MQPLARESSIGHIAPPVSPPAIWEEICGHIEGLALASTLAILDARGVLRRLAGGAAVPATALLGEAAPGFALVALRLAARLGWVEAESFPLGPGTRFRLTDEGLSALPLLPVHGMLAAGDPAAAATVLDAVAARVPASLARQVRRHLAGHVLAAPLLRLHDAAAESAAPCPDALSGQVVAALRDLGWAGPDGALTPAGSFALRCAPQYRHVLCYGPLLGAVPSLLAGGAAPRAVEHAAQETHLDRDADIRFSGDVYRRTCALAAASIARTALAAGIRPRAIVDLGAGDGSMLVHLHGVLAPELPGLVAVALDPSAVARACAAERLATAGIPHRVLAGDIAEPAAVGAALHATGLDPRQVLFATKSVLHDRALGRRAASGRAGRSEGAFADAAGGFVPAQVVEADLVDCLAGWREVMGPAGMLVIEAHTAPLRDPLPLASRGIVAALEATHGYSSQYLLEPAIHLACCEEAGLRSAASQAIGEAAFGFAPLTLTWLRPG